MRRYLIIGAVILLPWLTLGACKVAAPAPKPVAPIVHTVEAPKAKPIAKPKPKPVVHRKVQRPAPVPVKEPGPFFGLFD